MNHKIVIVVDDSTRQIWAESLLRAVLNYHGTEATIYSLQGIGELQKFISADMNVIELPTVRSLLKSILLSKKKGDSITLVSTSHKSASLVYLVGKFVRIRHVNAGMNQPNYFPEMTRVGRTLGHIHELIRHFYSRNSSILIAFSGEVTENFLKKRISEDKIVKVSIGVDTSKVPLVQKKLFPSDWRYLDICAVGRLSWEKNYPALISILSCFRDRGWTGKCFIIGEGPLRAEIEHLVSSVGLNDQIEICGWVENIKSFYDRCNVLIHTSRTESYGQAIIEARFSSLATISTPVGVSIDLAASLDSFHHQIPHEFQQSDIEKTIDFLTSIEGVWVKLDKAIVKSHIAEKNIVLLAKTIAEI